MKKVRDRRHGAFRLCAVLSVLAMLACLGAETAQASMKQISLNKLIRSAQLIVVGDVVDTTSEFVDGGNWIETLVTIRVYSTLKGTHSGPLVVRIGGGEVGGVRMSEEHQPQFEVGSSVILFLESKGGEYSVTGLFQGKFDLLGGGVYRGGGSRTS